MADSAGIPTLDKTTRSDMANLACLAAACGAAHAFPYHVLVLAYAIMGPAHYLTEIAWLREKRYFAARMPGMAVPLSIAACIALLVVPDVRVKGSILVCCVLAAIASVVVTGARSSLVVACVGVGALALVLGAPPAAVFVAILVPSVVHVYAFTGAFMVAGARRSGRLTSWLAVGGFAVASASFLLPVATGRPDMASLRFWDDVVASLGAGNDGWATTAQAFGFLSFAYAYHYLNWMAKVEVIRWHDVSPSKLPTMVGIYAMTLAAYAYDYTLGFVAMYVLSMVHVLLELPLNVRTFASFLPLRPRAAPQA